MLASPPGPTTEVTVRSADVDKMGVARPEQYFGWFSRSRETYLDNRGWSGDLQRDLAVSLPVVESYLRLRLPAGYKEILVISPSPISLESYRFCLAYRVIRTTDGAHLADGRTVHACHGPEGGRRRLPAPLLAALG